MKDELVQFLRETSGAYCQSQGAQLPEDFEFDLNLSKDTTHGDYASNLAFKVSRLVKKSPRQVADELIRQMKDRTPDSIEQFEVGGNGFINIYLSKACLNDILLTVIHQKEDYGKSSFGKAKKTLVEFVSANPTGPLTIAHGRQAVVGDVIVRILRAAGYSVSTEYYLNDSGRQMNLLGESLWARYQQVLGKEAALPEDGYQGEYLVDLARKLVASQNDRLLKAQDSVDQCREFAKEEILSGIRAELDRVGIRFDHYFSESSLYDQGEIEKAFQELKAKDFLYEQDGALWFRSTSLGDDKDRVVKKTTGELTYLAPDMAYHRNKFKRGYQWLIDLMGPDHHGYIARLKAACKALGYDPNALEVRIVQLSTLYRKGEPVRMSTRAGEFVTLAELLDEAGVDATRFFFVMRKVDSHLDFDLDLAKQKTQDNPVFYLQYAHARIASILRNANRPLNLKAAIEKLSSEEETALIKSITEFPQVITSAAEWLEPYKIADYLRDLATAFHKFYSVHRVLTEDVAMTDARLLLVEATRIVLKNGLTLLAISQPESM